MKFITRIPASILLATVLLLAFQNCGEIKSKKSAGEPQTVLEAGKYTCGITKDGVQVGLVSDLVLTTESKLIGEVGDTKYYAVLAKSPEGAISISQVKVDESFKIAMATQGQDGRTGGMVALLDEALKENAYCMRQDAVASKTDAATSKYRCVLSLEDQQVADYPDLTLTEDVTELISVGGEKFSVSLAAEPKGAISLYHVKPDGSATVSIAALPDGPIASTFLLVDGQLANVMTCMRHAH